MKSMTIPVFLVISIVTGYLASIVLMSYSTMADAQLVQVVGLIEALKNAFLIIVGYHFGSSSGSKAKSDTLNELTGTGDGTSKTVATVKTDISKTVTTESPKEPPKGETP